MWQNRIISHSVLKSLNAWVNVKSKLKSFRPGQSFNLPFFPSHSSVLQWGAAALRSEGWGMNSVSPSAAQYAGGVMQDELAESRRQQPLERQGSFGLRAEQTPDPGREVTVEPDEMDKLKAKLMSAWNNVKYGVYFKEECLVRLSLLPLCQLLFSLFLQAGLWSLKPPSTRYRRSLSWETPICSTVKVRAKYRNISFFKSHNWALSI